jgi:hypothetical protein
MLNSYEKDLRGGGKAEREYARAQVELHRASLEVLEELAEMPRENALERMRRHVSKSVLLTHRVKKMDPKAESAVREKNSFHPRGNRD